MTIPLSTLALRINYLGAHTIYSNKEIEILKTILDTAVQNVNKSYISIKMIDDGYCINEFQFLFGICTGFLYENTLCKTQIFLTRNE